MRPAHAQQREAAAGVVSRPATDASQAMAAGGPPGPAALSSPRPLRSGTTPWLAPLASALVPGAGQAALHQDRFVGYLAVESYALLQYGTDLNDAHRQRREYRRLAATVARAYFSSTRPVGSFEYYERMEHFLESGVYDVIPGGVLEPEPDTLTYNGSVWLLARQTFFSNPDSVLDPSSAPYQAALAFYSRRAIRPEFRWSWRNAQLEQDLFRRSIARSNDAFRRSVTDLGIILANHVLSTVDAYVNVRLLHRPPDGQGEGEEGVVVTIPWAPLGRPAPPRSGGREAR